MSSIAIKNSGTKVSASKQQSLAHLFSLKCRAMVNCADPGDRAFVGYLKDLAENNQSKTTGKFLVFVDADEEKRIIFVVPMERDSNHGQPSQKISIGAVPKAAIEFICGECETSSTKVVFDSSLIGTQVVQTMGRIGSRSSLGRLVEVLE